MKKFLSLLLILVLTMSLFALTGCGNGSFKKGEYLYKAVNYAKVNDMDENPPLSVEVFSEELGCGTAFETAADIRDLCFAFKNIVLGKSTKPVDFPTTTCTLSWGDESYSFEFHDDVFMVLNKKGDDYDYYEVEGGIEFQEAAKTLLTNYFSLDTQYVEVANYEDVTIRLGKYAVQQNGDFSIEFIANNQGSKDYTFTVNPIVNGSKVHSYQLLGIAANNEIGYTVTIPTCVLKAYGIEKIGEVIFTVDLNESTETMGKGELLYTSEPYTIRTELFDDMDTDIIINKAMTTVNGVNVYLKLIENDTYTALGILYVNRNNEAAKVGITKLGYNGGYLDLTGSDFVYLTDASANSKTFAYIPLYNYVYDEKTYAVTKTPITELKIEYMAEVNGKKETSGEYTVE